MNLNDHDESIFQSEFQRGNFKLITDGFGSNRLALYELRGHAWIRRATVRGKLDASTLASAIEALP